MVLLRLETLSQSFEKPFATTPVEHPLRVMICIRSGDPEPRLDVPRWLATISFPRMHTTALTHRNLLRGRDVLMTHHDTVDLVVVRMLRPSIDRDLSLVSYGVTTLRAAGLGEQGVGVRQYGIATWVRRDRYDW